MNVTKNELERLLAELKRLFAEGKNDIELDQVCGNCHGRLIIILRPGSPGGPNLTIVEHEDAELEADHRVTSILDDWVMPVIDYSDRDFHES